MLESIEELRTRVTGNAQRQAVDGCRADIFIIITANIGGGNVLLLLLPKEIQIHLMRGLQIGHCYAHFRPLPIFDNGIAQH